MVSRDHCGCSDCRHPETKQRILDSFSVGGALIHGDVIGKVGLIQLLIKIPEDIKAKEVRRGEDGLLICCE